MSNVPAFLLVDLRELHDLRVVHSCCLFRSEIGNPDKIIRPAFKELRLLVSGFGLDPDSLLHVGVPEIVDGRLVSYVCCIEFPLPENAARVKILPGGRYAVLTVQKRPEKIVPAIRSFQGDYLPENGFIVDEDRPTYEYYFTDTLEYCVPIR
jgi:DNA gyrase inhibitor GyrI